MYKELVFIHFNTPFSDLLEAVCDGETELNRDALLIGETLGEGAFGTVVKAEALKLSHKTEKRYVAVKMLKGRPRVKAPRGLAPGIVFMGADPLLIIC